MRRWMAGLASRLAVRVRRFTVFVLTAEGSGLSRRRPLQLLDTLLQLLDQVTQLLAFRLASLDFGLERPVLGPKSCVLGFQFLDALITRVGIHAASPSPRHVAWCHGKYALPDPSAPVKSDFNRYRWAR